MTGNRCGFFDMEIGGSDWSGWHFGPWGRARNWRLTGPDGTSYTAGEILDLQPMRLDIDYLRLRVRDLEARQALQAVYLTPDEAATLRAASRVLERISSPYRTRRSLAGVVPDQDQRAESAPVTRRRGEQQHQGRKRA